MRNPSLQRLDVPLTEYQRLVREALAPHRLELLRQQEAWIRRFEHRVQRHLIRGADVDVTRIQPRLELVTTSEQHAIWRYCRLWGAIPYNRGCGRLLRYLLRDEGQIGAPIMGVIALSSPILICKPRDEWIGWKYPRDMDLKRRRLLSCMDLTVSMAVPPYNHLTAGKMICLSMLSNEVRAHYEIKYGTHTTPTGLQEGRLALITTTSLYGSSVQYNRLRVDNRRAYRLVGYTSGYGNAHVTEQEFQEMEAYLAAAGRQLPKGWGTGRSYRLRVYTAYYRHRHHEPNAVPHQHCRSVYVAPLAENAQAFLQDQEADLHFYDLPFAYIMEQWRERWLLGRLAKADVLERFRNADPFQQPLTAELLPVGTLD